MSNDPRGYYKLLGVNPTASAAEIRKAYNKKQAQFHPSGAMRRRMRDSPEYKALSEEQRAQKEKELDEEAAKVNEAFRVLDDEKQRSEYDSGIGEFGPSFGASGNPFADIFSHFAGGGRPREQRNQNIRTEVSLSLADVFKGRTATFRIKPHRTCSTCKGRGGSNAQTCAKCAGHGVVRMQVRHGTLIMETNGPCPACKGEGSVNKGPPCETCKGERVVVVPENVTVQFPPGIQAGETVCLRGRGSEFPGAPRGDVVFTVRVNMPPDCSRVDDHLVATVNVDLLTLIAGGQVVYEHPDGQARTVTVPPMRELGKCLVVRGEGFPGRKRRGDLFLQFNLVHNQRVDRQRLAEYIQPELPVGKAGGPAVAGVLGVVPRVQEREEGYEEGHGGFAENLFRSFSFF